MKNSKKPCGRLRANIGDKPDPPLTPELLPSPSDELFAGAFSLVSGRDGRARKLRSGCGRAQLSLASRMSGRWNPHSDACDSGNGNSRPVAVRRSREGGLTTVPGRGMKIRAVSTRINKPENDGPELLQEGEMEQVGRLI